ncbi:MAG: methionine--tRNA ligase [Deltaproteobacteria bacterium RBG_16_66_15]|nr:MAG: methionine--tRNA ligase [Deltaproteobacteria bacterium GWA2_65_63]OGP27101.1 MAG: methionine--tRNA ligase [Deltaproteobacteria bacterium GWB2_65_81]OGP36283.1 MAG: methionine--tRNA ligase [Deltaproteobacteria bacterium GWC2_66_88]OGP79511.1 MAG: methionine--tRNA ligase [Deltaproteobacteria bacterium RBG_16_66_15]HAM33388.1 methionine--tRNA ligase [Deltaproteobacteria bacterium]
MKETFYVTTPIYYVNDVPHIGHAYTTIACDALARWHRMKGRRVFFLTGTDEHGEKVQKTAASKGLSPRELADQVVANFQGLTPALTISNTGFIRTTEPRHYASVQNLFRKSLANGDIYLGEYEGWYCVPDEAYWTDLQLGDGGNCPACGRPVEKRKEPSYFFRLSKYQQPLLEYYRKNPGFLRPESRRNEVIAFVEGGLNDLSVSRTSLSWGIPVPDAPGHVIYVWYDALTNYITGLGYPSPTEEFKTFWPADVHMVGKDILRFHAVYWPAFLMSAGIAPPLGVFAHGWWTVEGRKMSKSLGNVVDPYEMVRKYGADAFRYFLLREVSFGLDGDFSEKELIKRANSELADKLGNLLNRSLGMLGKYFDGVVPAPGTLDPADAALSACAAGTVSAADAAMEDVAFHKALAAIIELVTKGNEYVQSMQPWALAKDPSLRARLGTVLYHALEASRVAALLMAPFTPTAAQKLWEALVPGGGPLEEARIDRAGAWGGLAAGAALPKACIVFPKIETGA